MPPWKQIVFTEIWVVFLQVSSEGRVNLYLSGVSFAFGIINGGTEYPTMEPAMLICWGNTYQDGKPCIGI